MKVHEKKISIFLYQSKVIGLLLYGTLYITITYQDILVIANVY